MISSLRRLFAFAVLLTAIGAGHAASAADAVNPAASFQSAACSDKMPQREMARCGFLLVPENRTLKNGKMIRVAVAIVRAASKTPDLVPLVYLAGGPGGIPIFTANQFIAQGLNADRDLILVDQRGTYYSQPELTCPGLDEFFFRQLGMVYDSATNKNAHIEAARGCRDHLLAMGADLSAYNTAENAADFADLRHVLGYKQWNVYGVSYGTDLALNLLRIDPRGIHSLVLDSTVPPDLVTLAVFWEPARDGFTNLFAVCADQPACRQRYPNLATRFTNLVLQLEAHPVTTMVTDPATKRTVSVNTDGGALANWLVGKSLIMDGYADIPTWIDDLAAGKPQKIAANRLASVSPPGYIGYGLTLGVICSEWYPYATRAQILSEGMHAFPQYPTSVLSEPPQFTYMTDDCAMWNVPKAPASDREPVHSPVPTLILSGSFDAITSLQWAKAVAATLPNSRVLQFPGLVHDVLAYSKCGQTVVNSFVAAPNAPDVGCLASVTPPVFSTP